MEPLKLADFGISSLLKINDPASKFGSPMFMAPEILRSDEYSYPADIFSLGTTFFYLFYKTTPGQIFIKILKEKDDKIQDINYLTNMYCSLALLNFDPFKFVKKPFEIPEELNKIIADCLSNEPRKRPNLKKIFEILTKVKKKITNELFIFCLYETKKSKIKKSKIKYYIY